MGVQDHRRKLREFEEIVGNLGNQKLTGVHGRKHQKETEEDRKNIKQVTTCRGPEPPCGEPRLTPT